MFNLATPSTSRSDARLANSLAIDDSTASPAEQALNSLASAMASERPIAYSVNLARLCGDVKAALLLSQLIYWTRVGVDVEKNGGWIFKSRSQWETETGLSRCEQESARAQLLKLGLIKENRQFTPARLAYRVVLQALGTALAQLLRAEPIQWTLFDVRSNAEQVRTLLGRNLAFYRQYAILTQSVSTAVFLAKAVAMQRALATTQIERLKNSHRKNGASASGAAQAEWFSLSPIQWAVETGLTSSQIRTGKQKLCQLSLLDLAVQEYPKRRQYLRINFNVLASLLVKQRLNATQAPKGLLGLFGMAKSKTMKAVNKPNDALPACPVNGQSDILSSCVAATQLDILSACIPGIQLDILSSKVLQTVKTPVFAVDGQSDILSSCPPSGQADILSRKVLQTIEKPAFAQNLASNAKSCKLDGWFSQQKSMSISAIESIVAVPSAGFDTTIGQKSHLDRLDFAALHAGARFLTTLSKTTTPTTDTAKNSNRLEIAAKGIGWFSQHVGGGVVVDEVDQEKEKTAPLLLPDAEIVAQPNLVANQSSDQELLWPTRLDDVVLSALKQVIRNHPVAAKTSLERQQLIVDEFAANFALGKVLNAPTYLASLLNRELRGELVIALAYELQLKRSAQCKAQVAKEDQQHGKVTQVLSQASPFGAVRRAARSELPVAGEALSAFWEAVLQSLEQRLSASVVSSWIKPCRPVLTTEHDIATAGAATSVLTLVCGNRFRVDHIRATLLPAILSSVNELALSHLGQAVRLELLTQWAAPKQATATGAAAPFSFLNKHPSNINR